MASLPARAFCRFLAGKPVCERDVLSLPACLAACLHPPRSRACNVTAW